MAASRAAPKAKVTYCSPTGDFCQGVVRQNGRLRAKISTFSFSGNYQLCLTNRVYGRQCELFRLRRDGNGIYQGSVGLARHFKFKAKGRYSVMWRLDGYRIGKKLRFRKG
jgi:hypothetical protein